jgi:hypothetical protein
MLEPSTVTDYEFVPVFVGRRVRAQLRSVATADAR